MRERVEDEPAIYTVDTVPPPDGEDSAYQAPTKVGPMARAAVVQMFAIAELEERAPESARRAATEPAPAESATEELPHLGDSDCSQLEPTGSVLIVESGVISRARPAPPPLPRPPRVPVFPAAQAPQPLPPLAAFGQPPVRAWNAAPPALTPAPAEVRPRGSRTGRRLLALLALLPSMIFLAALLVGVPFLFAYLLSRP